jgi:hypothetical protein
MANFAWKQNSSNRVFQQTDKLEDKEHSLINNYNVNR